MNIKKQADNILKSPKEKLEKIKLFCDLVREIPYKRIGSLDPQDMVKAGKGSCTPKHIFLATYLKKLDIPVKFLVIPFFYKKLRVKYPKDKIDIVNKMPIAYHTALKARLDGKWIILDVTWNSNLKKKGFIVNDIWNEKSDMKLGVVPEEIIEKDIDPRKFEKEESKKYTEDELLARKKFYKLLDSVIENGN
jgi:hypothetical protein